MKFYRFDFSAGYAQTESYEYGKLDDDVTDDYLQEIALDLAREHCEMYGIYPEEEEEETGVEYEFDTRYSEVPENEVEKIHQYIDFTAKEER